jgi:hypothetical protein
VQVDKVGHLQIPFSFCSGGSGTVDEWDEKEMKGKERRDQFLV